MLVSANSKFWDDVVFLDSKCVPHKGTLHFRYTEIAAAFVFICDSSKTRILENPKLYESDPTEMPVREVDGNYAIDLLYYSEFSFIDQPPRLCFHDPVQEFGISFTFSSKEIEANVKEFLKTFLTTDTPNLPGFFKIIRFVPPFAPPASKQRKMSSVAQVQLPQITYDEYANVILVFQQTITPKLEGKEYRSTLTDEFKDIHSIEEVGEAMRKHRLPKSLLFQTWATMLNVFQPNEVDEKLVNKYINTKEQWSNITNSQLLRSTKYCEYINNLTNQIKETEIPSYFAPEIHKFIKKTSFNILMSIAELERQFFQWTHPLIDILFIILDAAKISIKDEKIFVCDGIEMKKNDFEALIFWMMLKLLMRGELIRTLPLTKSNPQAIVEPLTQFLLKVIPYLHETVTQKLFGAIDTAPLVSGLFVDFLPIDEIQDVWTAAIASKNIFEFFVCFIIAGIAFSGLKLRSEEESQEEVPQTTTIELIRSSIKEHGLGFIIAATLLLVDKSRSIVGTDI